MDKIIKERLSVIVSLVIGSSTGVGLSLSGFIEAKDIKQWLTGIAIAFSLMISLIISAWFKSRSEINKKRFWKYSIGCTVIFIVMMVAFFISYNILVVTLPVTVQLPDNSFQTTDSMFIRGIYFTKEAKNEIKALKQANRSEVIDLNDLFRDSNNNIDKVWSSASRTLAKLLILCSYIFFIAALIGTITITTETLQH